MRLRRSLRRRTWEDRLADGLVAVQMCADLVMIRGQIMVGMSCVAPVNTVDVILGVWACVWPGAKDDTVVDHREVASIKWMWCEGRGRCW